MGLFMTNINGPSGVFTPFPDYLCLDFLYSIFATLHTGDYIAMRYRFLTLDRC